MKDTASRDILFTPIIKLGWRRTNAVLRIQSCWWRSWWFWRDLKATQKLSDISRIRLTLYRAIIRQAERKILAAITIQKGWFTHNSNVQSRAFLFTQLNKATLIDAVIIVQSVWRGKIARKNIHAEREFMWCIIGAW